jgi:hypothetical protein
MVIVDRIIHDFALPLVLHDFHGPQNPQLMGHGGIRLIAQHRYVTHTVFPIQQGQNDFQAGRVAQGFENVHHPGDVFIAWQRLLCLFHLVFMNAFHITDIHVSPQHMNSLSYIMIESHLLSTRFPKNKKSGACTIGSHTRVDKQARSGLTEWDETCI